MIPVEPCRGTWMSRIQTTRAPTSKRRRAATGKGVLPMLQPALRDQARFAGRPRRGREKAIPEGAALARQGPHRGTPSRGCSHLAGEHRLADVPLRKGAPSVRAIGADVLEAKRASRRDGGRQGRLLKRFLLSPDRETATTPMSAPLASGGSLHEEVRTGRRPVGFLPCWDRPT